MEAKPRSRQIAEGSMVAIRKGPWQSEVRLGGEDKKPGGFGFWLWLEPFLWLVRHF